MKILNFGSNTEEENEDHIIEAFFADCASGFFAAMRRIIGDRSFCSKFKTPPWRETRIKINCTFRELQNASKRYGEEFKGAIFDTRAEKLLYRRCSVACLLQET